MSNPRIPPHSLDNERWLLACMLNVPGCIPEVAGLVTAQDFYKADHQHLFHLLAYAHKHGIQGDYVWLEREMEKAGSPFGPADMLAALQAAPAVTNHRRYAARLAADALGRRLLRLAGELAEQVYAGDVEQALVDLRAQATSEGIRTDGPPEDLFTLDEFLSRVPPADHRPWVVPGMLRPGWRAILVAPEGVGKLLRLDEPVPTPSGWSTVGALHVGDEVFDQHGRRCQVTALSHVEPNPDTYTLRFSDGESIDACVDHQWLTIDYAERQDRDGGQRLAKVRTTGEIRDTLLARGGHTANHAVPVAGPLDCPHADLPIDPYLLGVWLGDGLTANGALCLGRRDADAIEAGLRGFSHHRVPSGERPGAVFVRVSGLKVALRAAGVLGHKHIPDAYLRASIAQRTALLRGLMDTDGTCASTGHGNGRGHGAASCELTLTCKALVDGALELVRTLGIKVGIKESRATLNGEDYGPRWRMTFQSPFNPFTVPWKAERWEPLRTQRAQYRYVKAVEPCEPSPMRCIAVDSPDHSFLVSRAMIPTHNSTIMRQLAVMPSQGITPFDFQAQEPITTLMVDLENSDDVIDLQSSPMVHRLRAQRGEAYESDRCWVWSRPAGLDLRLATVRGELEACIRRVRPSLVTFGPLYKAWGTRGNQSYEDLAAEVQQVLDDLRTRYSFALVMEHHAVKGDPVSGRRALDPSGSANWMRWPEFGIKLLPVTPDTVPPERQSAYRPRELTLGRFRLDRYPAAWPSRLLWNRNQGHNALSRPWVGVWEPEQGEPPSVGQTGAQGHLGPLDEEF